MSVDYTKVFTVIGKHGDKINDYYSYIATYTSDQAAIETILSAQSLVRLEEDLVDEYQSFKNDITSQIDVLIERVSTVLTDEQLIGANFSFGQSPTLQLVFPALIHDMTENDKNVAANAATVGSITYDTENADIGVLIAGTKLDGVTPPTQGALAILDYAGLTSQLTPTSETLTFTCISDSEHGTPEGSELFEITGVGPAGEGYDVSGESSGRVGTIAVVDGQAGIFVTNSSFDTWTSGEPDGWTVTDGDTGVDFEEGGNYIGTTGASLKFLIGGGRTQLTQILSSTTLERNKAYFINFWMAKDDDTGGDEDIQVVVRDSNGDYVNITATVTGTAWTNYSGQFVVPSQVTGDIELLIDSEDFTGLGDAVFLDKLVISPCEYFEGVAFAITTGLDKFLIGDTISIPLSNNDAGKFQTLFRKAFKIQLPVDGTPSISDSLYA